MECGGEVHLLGGSYLTTWTVYSPGQAWSERWPNVRLGRTEACAAVLGADLYLLGGQTIDSGGGVVSDCEKWDRVKQCWVRTRPMLTPRTRFSCVVLEEELYVLGGEGEGGEALAACEKFSPRTGQWSRLADLSEARRAPVTVVLDQVVFVVGGETNTAEWYDEESQTWVQTSTLPYVLQGAGGVVLTSTDTF